MFINCNKHWNSSVRSALTHSDMTMTKVLGIQATFYKLGYEGKKVNITK